MGSLKRGRINFGSCSEFSTHDVLALMLWAYRERSVLLERTWWSKAAYQEEGKGRDGEGEEGRRRKCVSILLCFCFKRAPSLLESAVYMWSVSLSGATPIHQSSLEMPLQTHPDRSLLIF